jgi:malonyl-CoA/methylmalonyl-CoA synthetase
MGTIELVERATCHGSSVAIVSEGKSYTYEELLVSSANVAAGLLGGQQDLGMARIGFLVPPGFTYAACQWGIWRAGGIAVPLGLQHPLPELQHVMEDAGISILVADPAWEEKLQPLAAAGSLPLLRLDQLLLEESTSLPEISLDRAAMILYTSGTTNRPKGVVTTHENIQAQTVALIDAWDWTAEDRILHVLPLHHIHGIINVLTCALWAGATCEILPGFEAQQVWKRLGSGELSLFMAVPTIYNRLITAWQAASATEQQRLSSGCSQLRLMVSGSAALPVSTLESWKSITGHVLLERYGMTEIGMALANPLNGLRVPGHVGQPLSNMEVRRVDEDGAIPADDVPGEIQVRGPGVFQQYWGNPLATEESFTEGWFRTGDVAVVEEGSYRILGRSSVDIIKTGGYKVSALEIEEVLRDHDQIVESAVVGLPDAEWGERVAACLVLEEGAALTLDELRSWSKERLAVYKVPSILLVLETLPRNAMGKVEKPAIKLLFPAAT